MEMDASLDKYLWEMTVCLKQENDSPWDFWSIQQQEELILKDFSKELEEKGVWSPGLPLLDGLVHMEQEIVEEYWEEAPLKLECREEEEWELEEKPDCPLLKDTFIGCREEDNLLYHTQIIPLARHWPRSVVFVGSEGSSIINSSHHLTTTSSSFHHSYDTNYHHQQQLYHDWQEEHVVEYPLNTPAHNSNYYEFPQISTQSSSSFYDTPNSQFDPSNVYLPPNNGFEQLLNIDKDVAGPSHDHYGQQQQQLQESVFEPLRAPQSIYSSSSSSDSLWNQQDSYTSDSLSQDEILQEIHRECTQIEERNSSESPPGQPSSSSKARLSKSFRRVNREPYALESSSRRKKHATPCKMPVSPSSSVFLDSPTNGTDEKKKELNRIAATKYREKKRLEKEFAVAELNGLEHRNTVLKAQCSAAEAEIEYLKGLIKEIETRAGNFS